MLDKLIRKFRKPVKFQRELVNSLPAKERICRGCREGK